MAREGGALTEELERGRTILEQQHTVETNPEGRSLWRDEEGHDFLEYTLLLAFLTMASAAMYIGAGGSLSTIWSASNTILSNASAPIPRS